jgi:glutamine synthetase
MIDSVSIDILHSFFAMHKTVRFVRYQWLDLFGILRTYIATINQEKEILLSEEDQQLQKSSIVLSVATVHISSLEARLETA